MLAEQAMLQGKIVMGGNELCGLNPTQNSIDGDDVF